MICFNLSRKFSLCPSLGFESCQEKVCYDNPYDHVRVAHNITSLPGPHQSTKIIFEDFLSTKTLKKGTCLTWVPLLVKAFPDTSPFLILCELEPKMNCLAKFFCIHTGETTNLEDGSSDMEMQFKSYRVEISIQQNDNHFVIIFFYLYEQWVEMILHVFENFFLHIVFSFH